MSDSLRDSTRDRKAKELAAWGLLETMRDYLLRVRPALQHQVKRNHTFSESCDGCKEAVRLITLLETKL